MVAKVFDKVTEHHVYVNMDKVKNVRNSVARGKYYASYYDPLCQHFAWWLKRKNFRIIEIFPDYVHI